MCADVNNILKAIRLTVVLVAQLSIALNLNGAAGPAKKRASVPAFPDDCVLSLTFKSKVDGSFQRFLARLPKGYTTSRSWPLLVTLHGLRDGPILAPDIKSMVQIGPYGRGSVWFTGIGREDVFECIEKTRKFFSIDDDRIYLCGFSMGGAATFKLGLSYPDMWAGCVPVCGRCDEPELVENGRDVAFWVNTGGRDKILSPEHSQTAFCRASALGFSKWRYTEHKEMGHSFDIDWKQVEHWLLATHKARNPKRVTFCTKTLQSNRAYWVEVTGIKQYGKTARIDVAIEGQNVSVSTRNVSNYTLRLNNNLIDLTRGIKITENGTGVFQGIADSNGCFVRKRSEAELVKRPGLSGPLWDIYTSSCVLVYGTDTREPSLVQAAKRCAESFANPHWMDAVHFKIVADTAVNKQILEANNIVLFGNVNTNKVLAEISDKLPIEMNGKSVIANATEYHGEHIGYVLIFPNPLNPGKYAAVFAGSTPASVNCFDKIWPSFRATPRCIDFGVFDLDTDGGTVRWLATGLFGTNWDGQSFDQQASGH